MCNHDSDVISKPKAFGEVEAHYRLRLLKLAFKDSGFEAGSSGYVRVTRKMRCSGCCEKHEQMETSTA